MYPQGLGATRVATAASVITAGGGCLRAGPKPGTVMDAAATLGWRAIRAGERICPTSPTAAPTTPRPAAGSTAPTFTPGAPITPTTGMPSAPARAPNTTPTPTSPAIPFPTTSGGSFLPGGVQPVTSALSPAPSVPVVPTPAQAAATIAKDALPQASIVLPPVVNAPGGQVQPASTGASLVSDGGGTPISSPASTVVQAGMDPKLLIYALGAAVLLTFLANRKRR